MTIAKIAEITAESNSSFDDAIRQGITRAAKTLDNLKGAWVKDQEVIIKNNKPETYRVTLKLTFVLND